MKDLINSIIKNQVNKYFEFELTEGNSVKKLKKAAKLVPNLSGIYLVFSEGLNESTHLNFKISNKNYSLLYFGKAGGITNSGRVIIQGLNSRINNVVSDSTRGMKDVKRAKYWNDIMLEFGIEKLHVVCHIHDAPQQLENIIYDYLDRNNLQYPLMNKKRGRLTIKSNFIKKTEMKNNLVEKKIKNILKNIHFENLRNKPKLLIIPCSHRKRADGTDFFERNYFNSEIYKYLNLARELRKYHYKEIINSNPNKFVTQKDTTGNGIQVQVDGNYFIDLINNNNNLLHAFERYEGKFYSNELRNLYFQKHRESNLHILIISGLYGIIEFNDEITDYDLKINDGINLWSNILTDTINQYIIEKNIDHSNVFYALSDEYLKKINPNQQWKNLWINKIGKSRQSNLKYSADCVLNFLHKI
jgi:cytoplasmic iron level regulating protein YaaA (DUF328/UPF0246 family)